jgi:hypothetical protein
VQNPDERGAFAPPLSVQSCLSSLRPTRKHKESSEKVPPVRYSGAKGEEQLFFSIQKIAV